MANFSDVLTSIQRCNDSSLAAAGDNICIKLRYSIRILAGLLQGRVLYNR